MTGTILNLTIRAFEPGDRPSLEKLWGRVFADDPPWNAPAVMIENKLRVQPESLLVGIVDETLVGAVMAGFDGVRGWIYHLAVAPELRRRGIATQLVRAAEARLREQGCTKVNIQIRASNSEVVAFYQSLGFAIEERVSMGRRLEGAGEPTPQTLLAAGRSERRQSPTWRQHSRTEFGTDIREIEQHELGALLDLYSHLHANDEPLPSQASLDNVWTEALANPRCRYFGGFDRGRLVSSCTITLIPNLTRGCRPYGVIENVVTHTAFRGRGWGRALLARALEFAWSHRCYKVMLFTGRRDEASLRFYEKAGFDRHSKQAFIARPNGRSDVDGR